MGQILVPEASRKNFLAWCHLDRDGRHLNLAATKAKGAGFYFPSYSSDMQQYFRACEVCQGAFGPEKRRHVVTGRSPSSRNFGEILMMDYKSFASESYVSMMDHCTRCVEMFPVQSHSVQESKAAFMSWMAKGVTVSQVWVDKEKSLTCREFVDFVATFDGCRVVPSKGYDPEHIAPLERFHKELLREERQIGDDTLAKQELPMVLRRWHRGLEGKTHISRADNCYGANLALRAAVLAHREKAAADNAAVAQKTLDFKVGQRVKVLAHPGKKSDPKYRLALIKTMRLGTLGVTYEDTGETVEVNEREVVQIIPSAKADDAMTPRLHEVFMTRVGGALAFFKVVRTANEKVLGQLLRGSSRKKMTNRKFLPVWKAGEADSDIASESPPSSPSKPSPRTLWVLHSDIIAIGERAANGLLSASLTAAYTQAVKP